MLVLDQLPALTDIEGFTDWDVRGLELRQASLIEELPPMRARPEPAPGDLDARYMFRLVVDGNVRLRSMVGLPPLGYIWDGLVIRDNDMLIELAGLEHLQQVSADGPAYAVLIEGNMVLRNLDALDPSIEGSFAGHGNGQMSAIRDNQNLPTCLIEDFLREVYMMPVDEVSSWVVEGNSEEPCS